jgi:hypothetical protein
VTAAPEPLSSFAGSTSLLGAACVAANM